MKLRYNFTVKVTIHLLENTKDFRHFSMDRKVISVVLYDFFSSVVNFITQPSAHEIYGYYPGL